MVRLHDSGTLRDFANPDAIVAHFDLSSLTADDYAGIKAASDAGFPLHAAIDPFHAEIHYTRVLLLETSDEDLREEVRQRQMDI